MIVWRKFSVRAGGRRLLDAALVVSTIVGLSGGAALHAQDALASGPSSIRAKMARDGSAHICVVLRDPEPRLRSPHAKEGAYAACQERFLGHMPRRGCETVYRYRFSPVVVVNLRSFDALAALERDEEVARIELDGEGEGALDDSRQRIGADALFDQGITGGGRVVAILDTGVEAKHPDLEGSVLHEHHFLGQGADIGPGAPDRNGHGTHVAGVAASRGASAARGVAPGVHIVAVKVLDDRNRGFFADWAAGVEHVVALHESRDGPRVDAINMSFASGQLHTGVCDDQVLALMSACEAAREAGIVLFAASGNQGLPDRMALPACYSSVVSVASVDKELPERVSDFSNRNAILDLLAPGANISSLALGGGAAIRSGTSFATPHATAAACLLRQVDPSITPRDVADLLARTGAPVLDEATGRVFPRLDVLHAVEMLRMDLAGRFIRGDCNGDGSFDISDPIRTLIVLFLGGGGRILCNAACDVDDDDVLGVGDAIISLRSLFEGAIELSPPFPACGRDPTPSSPVSTCESPACQA